MVRASRPGRPALPGDRYPCGRRKPQGDARGTQVWQQIRQHGWRLGVDEDLRHEIGRLSFDGLLTDHQVETCREIGRVYAQFHRLHGKRRSPASPSYMRSFGARMEDDRDVEYAAKVEQAMASLQACFSPLENRVRNCIEALCVDGYSILIADLDRICDKLDYIAGRLGIRSAREPKHSAPLAPLRPRHSASTSPRIQPARKRNNDSIRKAVIDTIRAMDPSADEAKLQGKWEEVQGRIDRERFRTEKQRKRQ
jgi:hypothetical protein